LFQRHKEHQYPSAAATPRMPRELRAPFIPTLFAILTGQIFFFFLLTVG
jgi:hypothetical protein